MTMPENKRVGRILRVKKGYNPNSSSVGSQIPALFLFYAGSGALAVVILQAFRWVETLIKKQINKQSACKSPAPMPGSGHAGDRQP